MSKTDIKQNCFFFHQGYDDCPYCISREHDFVDYPYQCNRCKWYVPKDSAYKMVKSLMMFKCFMNHQYK